VHLGRGKTRESFSLQERFTQRKGLHTAGGVVNGRWELALEGNSRERILIKVSPMVNTPREEEQILLVIGREMRYDLSEKNDHALLSVQAGLLRRTRSIWTLSDPVGQQGGQMKVRG